MTSVNQKMARGIAWMLGARLMDRSIGIISTLILARLLVPDDFGLVAMATAIVGLLELLGAFNLDVALIQRTTATRAHYDTVWTFNVLFGVCCGVGLALLAVPASSFYREPRLEHVMYVLGFAQAVSGFTNVAVVEFRKEMRFHDEFKFMFLRRIVTFFTTLGCALLLRSYWALVIGIVAGRLASVWISYVMCQYRPSWALSAGRELFHFSKWLFINNTLFFFMHSAATFIIGRINGANAVGIYTVSYEISNMPSSELVAPINRATLPGFANMQNIGQMGSAYLKLFAMIVLVVLPAGIGIAAVAEPLVAAALGLNWVAAIPLMKLLALNGAVAATQTNNGVVWIALGRTRDLTLYAAGFVVLLMPTMIWQLGVSGVVGAAYAYLFAQIAMLPLAMWNTKRLLHLQWTMLLAPVWRPVIACLLMYTSVATIDGALEGWGSWIRLVTEIAIGALAYAISVLALWFASGRPNGAESFCLEYVRRAVRRVV